MKIHTISDNTKSSILHYLSNIKKSDSHTTFSWILEDIYDHDATLLPKEVLTQSINISSGVSDVPAYSGFLNKISEDILSHKYYRQYSAAQGNYNLRKFISSTENSRSELLSYSFEDICITEGASGAVSSVIEYVSECFNQSEIIIPVPSYYGYKVSANHHNLSFREVILSSPTHSPSYSSLKNIIDSISNKTKLIMITYPDNPSGLLYSLEEVTTLIKIAKKKNILIIFDQVFLDLIFDKTAFEIDVIAKNLSASQNIAIIRSFSKNHNLPGLRIGYIVSNNQQLIDHITKIQESRVLFATGSSHKGLFFLDGIFRQIENTTSKDPTNSIEKIIDQVKKNTTIDTFEKFSEKQIVIDYLAYQEYKKELLAKYSNSYDLVFDLLKDSCVEFMPKASAFNTFVKLKNMDRINMFDFCLNLFLATGLKVALGPYFGLNQYEWEHNDKLGFWLRITFGVNGTDLKKGIKILIAFIQKYKKTPDAFIKLKKYY